MDKKLKKDIELLEDIALLKAMKESTGDRVDTKLFLKKLQSRINYLKKQNLMKEEIKLTQEQKDKLIANVETKIVNMLLRAPAYSVADGYYGWHVGNYKGFIWQFAILTPLERDFVDDACESLLKKSYIEVGEGDEYKDVYIRLEKQYFASQI